MSKDFESRIADRISGGSVRTAGKIEFIRDTGPVHRSVRADNFEFTAESFKNLAKLLWLAQRAHSFGVASLRLISKIPSSQISPDGMLGGKGYIQTVKDMRNGLSQAVETLSAFTDTLYDEVNGKHWSNLSPTAEKLIEDTEKVKKDPEQYVEDEFHEEDNGYGSESEVTEPETVDDLNPTPEDFGQIEEEEDEEEDFSDGFSQVSSHNSGIQNKLPEWDDKDIEQSIKKAQKSEEEDVGCSNLPTDGSIQEQAITAPEMTQRTMIPSHGNFASAIKKYFNKKDGKVHTAGGNSSVPVETLPGPRITEVGPGVTEFGWFNDDAAPSDDQDMSGILQYEPIYEDNSRDGVTGDDNPTDGDSSVLAIASKLCSKVAIEHYSWLPGSDNSKNMNYYQRGLSEADIQWMRENSAPDDPMKPIKIGKKPINWSEFLGMAATLPTDPAFDKSVETFGIGTYDEPQVEFDHGGDSNTKFDKLTLPDGGGNEVPDPELYIGYASQIIKNIISNKKPLTDEPTELEEIISQALLPGDSDREPEGRLRSKNPYVSQSELPSGGTVPRTDYYDRMSIGGMDGDEWADEDAGVYAGEYEQIDSLPTPETNEKYMDNYLNSSGNYMSGYIVEDESNPAGFPSTGYNDGTSMKPTNASESKMNRIATNIQEVRSLTDNFIKEFGKSHLTRRHVLAFLQKVGSPQFLASDIIRCLCLDHNIFVRDVMDEFPIHKSSSVTKMSSIRGALVDLELLHIRDPEIASNYRTAAAELTKAISLLERMNIKNV